MRSDSELAEGQLPPARPLGLRADVKLSAPQLRSLQTFEDYDLSPVLQGLIRKGMMPPRWAAEAGFEFRRYLGLRAVFPEPIPMTSEEVDEAWHACILNTRLYADLCQQAFGSFLHHDPEVDISDREVNWTAFECAYQQLYGTPTHLWLLFAPDP